MTLHPADPSEQALRDALRAEADRVLPAGDGLMRIQDRVARRSRRLRLLRPAAAALAVLVVVAGGVVSLSLLGHDGGVSEIRTVERPTASPSPSQEPAPTAIESSPAGVAPAAGPLPVPTGAGALPNLPTCWPYTSRTDARAGLTPGPETSNPRTVALRFVQVFLQHPEVDTVTAVGPKESGLAVTLGRRVGESGRTVEVTTVYLVRVATGENAPYVVVSATSPLLSITAPTPGAPIRSPLPVSGRITGVDESIHVELRVLSRPAPVGSAFTGGGGENSPWAQSVSFPALADKGATVVAWTASAADGKVGRLAAQPVGPAGG
ncbi:MAG: hypothetical protein NVSMB13_09500 [Mycobacteriales bacterium]